MASDLAQAGGARDGASRPAARTDALVEARYIERRAWARLTAAIALSDPDEKIDSARHDWQAAVDALRAAVNPGRVA